MNDLVKSSNLQSIKILLLVLLSIMIFTLNRVFSLMLEDLYGQPLSLSLYKFLFSEQYAINTAWFICTAAVFIIMNIWFTKKVKLNTNAGLKFLNNSILKYFFYINSTLVFFNIINIVYSFLNGNLDQYSLLNILTSLATLGLAILYCSVDLYYPKFIVSKYYNWTVSLLTILLIILVITITMIFASPNLQRTARRDFIKINEIVKIAESIQKYYNNYVSLPNSIDDLVKLGLLTENDLADSQNHKYVYKIISARSFDVCGNFGTNVYKIRRFNTQYSGKLSNISFKEGNFCQRYFVEKTENGKYEIELTLNANNK